MTNPTLKAEKHRIALEAAQDLLVPVTVTVGYGRLRSVTVAFLQRRPAHRAGALFHPWSASFGYVQSQPASVPSPRVGFPPSTIISPAITQFGNHFCTAFCTSRKPPVDYQALAQKPVPGRFQSRTQTPLSKQFKAIQRNSKQTETAHRQFDSILSFPYSSPLAPLPPVQNPSRAGSHSP